MLRTTAKQLVAIAAISTLSLVVACSGGNGGAGGGGSSALPASPLAASDIAADYSVANTKSPVKVGPAKLVFTSSGAGAAKKINVNETKYRAYFKHATTCGKDVKISPATAKGPKASFLVTPLASATCTITFTDKAKNKSTVSVVVKLATPTPSPSPSPTATPTASPTPAGAAIANGNFASGKLSPGWTACSFVHAGYAAPIDASPAPAGVYAQPTTPTAAISAANLAQYGNSVGTPPPNLNPGPPSGLDGPLPAGLSSKAAMTGDQNSQNEGAAGICQTFTVPASATYLSFWAYEGGSEYSFGYADQEADVMTADGTAIQKTLFAEDNCFWDPGVVGATGYYGSGCIPPGMGGTTAYTDWQGGYWTKRGPYNLSAYAGKSITLFLGVWSDRTENSPYPDTYNQEMWVTNVQMSSSSTFPATFDGARRAKGRNG